MLADVGLPIWSAVDQAWPEAAQQRCWNHKILNVLNDLPSTCRAPPGLMTQIPTAKTRQQAQKRRDRFAARYGEAYQAAVAILERDWERMVTFFDFPEAHWKHLGTTNLVESPFASVRLRTNAGKRYKRVQGGHRPHLARTQGGRDTIPQAQRADAPAGSLRRTEIPGRKPIQGVH